MFKKQIQCNCFVYYGIFTTVGEIERAMKRFKHNGDVYTYVFSSGLEYKRVGSDKNSNELIVGLPLDQKQNFIAMKINKDQNNDIILQHKDGSNIKTKLTYEEENEINKKIYKLGFFGKPEYYIFHNYTFNEIK